MNIYSFTLNNCRIQSIHPNDVIFVKSALEYERDYRKQNKEWHKAGVSGSIYVKQKSKNGIFPTEHKNDENPKSREVK